VLHFFDREIAYDKISAVETRSVLFGNAMAPVLLRATRGCSEAWRARAARHMLGCDPRPRLCF